MSGLHLDLPPQPAVAKRSSPVLVILLLTQLLGLALLSYIVFKEKRPGPPPPQSESLEAVNEGDSSAIIVKLKKAGANEQAARLLGQLAKNSQLDKLRRAELQLQCGDTWQEAGNRGEALMAFYQAEDLAGLDTEVGRKAGTKIIDLMRLMGRYDRVGSEITRRDRLRKDGKQAEVDPVLATIDGRPYRESEFLQAMEQHISERIAQAAGPKSSQEDLDKLKTDLQKQYEQPANRNQLLQQVIQEEILDLEARRWELEKHPDYEKAMAAFQKRLLRSLLISTRLEVTLKEEEVLAWAKAHWDELKDETTPESFSDEAYATLKNKALELATVAAREKKSQEFTKHLMESHQVEITKP